MSVWAVIDPIIGGEHHAERLADLSRGRLKAPRAVVAALQRQLTPASSLPPAVASDPNGRPRGRRARPGGAPERALAPVRVAVDRPMAIPAVRPRVILAAIGFDMGRFPTTAACELLQEHRRRAAHSAYARAQRSTHRDRLLRVRVHVGASVTVFRTPPSRVPLPIAMSG
jgi:hypothetical protein